MPSLISHNEPETLAIGRAIGALLVPGDVVAIDGPLGTGKTRLIRGMAMGLGLPGSVVSSPTYVVVNEYVIAGEGDTGLAESVRPRRLFHVDAYRLSGPEDLDSLGWDRVVDPTGDAAVAIEWAERIHAGEGSPTDMLNRARTASPDHRAEPAVCRVRMEPIQPPEGHAAPTAETDEPPPGLRLINIDPPSAWSARGGDAWRDWQRLSKLLCTTSGDAARSARLPLPTGWARCPTSGRAVPPDAPTFPFADARSRMTDLGRWMTGAYTVSREIGPEDEVDADLGPHTA